MTTIAHRIVRFAVAFDVANVPEAVRHVVKLHVMDTVGVCLAASRIGPGERVAALTGAGASATGDMATVIGFDRQVPAGEAALANGILAHSLEFDDTHTPSVIHPGAVVVPTALAVGEGRHSAGRDVLGSMVLGYETLIRLGLASPGAFQRNGFQTTAVCGPFAAALIAGVLHGFDEERLVGALGIAGSQSSGVFEYLSDGSSVKQLHQGWASFAGMMASRLAASGFRGPRTVFEGRFGLYATHAATAPDAAVFEDFGAVWHAPDLSVKPYPCCHFNQAFIDCANSLRTQIQDMDEIAAIECRIAAAAAPIVCEPADRKRVVVSGYDAKFSLPYAVAAGLLDGHVGHEAFTDESARRDDLMAMASRVSYTPFDDPSYPTNLAGHVEIRLRSGRTVTERVPHHRGGPLNPMPDGDVVAKFLANAAYAIDQEAAETLRDLILNMEQVADVAEIGATLRRGALRHGRHA